MKYKVGDKVRVKSREWYERERKDGFGSVNCGVYRFTKNRSLLCGQVVEIKNVFDDYYEIKENDDYWSDEMFDGLVFEEKSTISTDLIKDIAEVVKSHNLGVCVSEKDGKLIIEPLEKKEEDLVRGAYVMVTNDINNEAWTLRQYLSNGYCDAFKADLFDLPPMKFRYIIPFDKFNPNNIEESLKYNIVK